MNKKAFFLMNRLIIARAVQDDLPAILDVQKKAFLEVARSFHLTTLPPLEQTLDSVALEFEKGVILKATVLNTLTTKKQLDSGLRRNDIRIVGSVRAYQKDDTCFIGKLVVVPEYQNQGIGQALMREVESHYRRTVRRYEIFTGSRDPRNRHLYDQLGYQPFRSERINEELTFVYMEKSVKR